MKIMHGIETQKVLDKKESGMSFFWLPCNFDGIGDKVIVAFNPWK